MFDKSKSVGLTPCFIWCVIHMIPHHFCNLTPKSFSLFILVV